MFSHVFDYCKGIFMDLNCGKNTATKQKTHYVLVLKKQKTVYVYLGPKAKMTRPAGSPSWSMSGQMLG